MRRFLTVNASCLMLLLLAMPGLANMGSLGRPVIPLDYLKRVDKDAKPLEKVPADKIVRVREKVPVTLTYRSDIKSPQLLVPKKFAIIEDKPGAMLNGDAPSGRTALAGVGLSLAFVTGGFWLTRRRSGQTGKSLILAPLCAGVVCTVFFAGLTGDVAWGNLAPVKPKVLAQPKADEATVAFDMDITITTDGDRIQLFLPKDLLPLNMVPQREFWGWGIGSGGMNHGRSLDPEITRPK